MKTALRTIMGRCLVHIMSENTEKYQKFKARSHSFVLPNQQPLTQRYFIYCHTRALTDSPDFMIPIKILILYKNKEHFEQSEKGYLIF